LAVKVNKGSVAFAIFLFEELFNCVTKRARRFLWIGRRVYLALDRSDSSSKTGMAEKRRLQNFSRQWWSLPDFLARLPLIWFMKWDNSEESLAERKKCIWLETTTKR
jgi:hypothetical protein